MESRWVVLSLGGRKPLLPEESSRMADVSGRFVPMPTDCAKQFWFNTEKRKLRTVSAILKMDLPEINMLL
jgi:hypothetical protein